MLTVRLVKAADNENLLEVEDPYRKYVIDFFRGSSPDTSAFSWPDWVQRDLLSKIERGKRTTENIINTFGDLRFKKKSVKVSDILLGNLDAINRRVSEPWFNLMVRHYNLEATYKSNLNFKEIPNHEKRLKNALYMACSTPETMPPLIMRNSKLLEGYHRFIAIASIGVEKVEVYVGRSSRTQREALKVWIESYAKQDPKEGLGVRVQLIDTPHG